MGEVHSQLEMSHVMSAAAVQPLADIVPFYSIPRFDKGLHFPRRHTTTTPALFASLGLGSSTYSHRRRKGHGDHALARLRGGGAPAHQDDAPGRVSLIVPIVGADGGGGAR
jgi:hypothetical protein